MVLLLPIPFYIRLGVYYVFEHPEIVDRYEAASVLGMPPEYNFRLLRYLTPTHPVFATAYIIYFLAGFSLAVLSGRPTKTRYQEATISAFTDLKNLSMLSAVGMLIKNCLWPFKKYGIWGCFLGLIYWPFIMPVSIVTCIIYCIPLIFLSIQVVYYTMKDPDEEITTGKGAQQSVKQFEADQLLHKDNLKKPTDCCYCSVSVRRMITNIVASAFILLTIYSIMLMAAEVVGFIAEVLCFTMMGLIINASKVLKYGTLIFLVIMYSYDTYNNVNKKYLKLNKALFSDIKWRLGKDIDQFTSLPSYLQGNRGFKAAEASDQAEYETIDDLSNDLKYHLDINDLILFIDTEDNPRIPRKLFDDVCQVRVAGSPGPVYRSLLAATWKFMIIVFFIGFTFIVVLSFGENYKMSSTNQMLATLAGGFMPMIFRHVLKPGSATVETGLVSFRSKLEEIIQNFCQSWPLYDFQFEVEEPPKEEEEEKEEDELKKEDGDGEEAKDTEVKGEPAALTADNKEKKPEEKEKDDRGNIDEKKEKKDKEKDKEKKEDKEDKAAMNGATQPQEGQHNEYRKFQSHLVRSVKAKVEEMEAQLEPLSDKKVDILVLVQESDQEWLMEWSSMSNLDEATQDLKEANHINNNIHMNHIGKESKLV